MSTVVCNRGGKTDDAKWLMETLYINRIEQVSLVCTRTHQEMR